MKHQYFLLLLLISISAYTNASGDPTAGQTKSAACQGCHGTDGNSYSPDWPNLANQNVKYLVKQIADFQSGARKDPTMNSMVTNLSKSDIADISSFFSAQKLKLDPNTDARAGEKIYVGGNRYNKLPACAACHGPNAAGNGPGAIPLLLGQKAGYTTKTLRDFRSKTRTNDFNNIMQDVAAKMTDKEIEAVAAYLASMGPANNKPQE